jgi:small subunit ribosomal protein S20
VANSAQAKKRARQAEVRRGNNASKRSEMRTYLKGVNNALLEGNQSLATTIYQKAVSTVDRLVNKGIIHKNKAARHKSRLNARIKALNEAK